MRSDEFDALNRHLSARGNKHDRNWGFCTASECVEAWRLARELELPWLAARYLEAVTR